MIQHVRLKWLIAILVLALPAAAADAAIVIDTVAVGNVGNAGELSGAGAGGFGPNLVCGAVGYAYNIGTYEVTAGQYRDFLNAVDPTGANTNHLYNAYMDTNQYGCQITWNSVLSTYDFSGGSGTAADWENRPVNYVSWYDALRFANWLHNGQGSSDTEDGAYDMSLGASVVRELGATWVLPTEDEWYKAAYHKNDGDTGNYFDYPTGSDTVPSNVLNDGGNNATFYDVGYTIGSPYYRTEFGAHENSDSPYGTFDQGGNVWEWNEANIYGDGSHRGLRGGSFGDYDSSLQASYRSAGFNAPSSEYYYVGFRVASSAAIPEPGSVLVWAGLGIIGLFWWRRRR